MELSFICNKTNKKQTYPYPSNSHHTEDTAEKYRPPPPVRRNNQSELILNMYEAIITHYSCRKMCSGEARARFSRFNIMRQYAAFLFRIDTFIKYYATFFHRIINKSLPLCARNIPLSYCISFHKYCGGSSKLTKRLCV